MPSTTAPDQAGRVAELTRRITDLEERLRQSVVAAGQIAGVEYHFPYVRIAAPLCFGHLAPPTRICLQSAATG